MNFSLFSSSAGYLYALSEPEARSAIANPYPGTEVHAWTPQSAAGALTIIGFDTFGPICMGRNNAVSRLNELDAESIANGARRIGPIVRYRARIGMVVWLPFNSDLRKLLEHAVSAYGFTLKQGGQSAALAHHTFADLAEEISRVYDPKEPRHKAIIRALKHAHALLVRASN